MKIVSKEEVEKVLVDILSTSDNNIIVHEDDVNILTSDKELLAMSVAQRSGSNSARETINSAVLDFQKKDLLLTQADSILVYFQVHSNYDVMSLSDAMEIIYSIFKDVYVLNEADILFGIACDDSLENDYVKTTMFMGYSKQKKLEYVNNLM